MTNDQINLILGNCLEILPTFSHKFDLILADPPFMPMNETYKQIREENQTQLEEIITPKNYVQWWEQICLLCQSLLSDKGWFIFKSDAFTSKRIFLNTCQYFDYASEVIWDKQRIGLGYYIRSQHEHLEFYRPKNAKNSFIKNRTHRYRLKGNSHGGSKGKAFSSIISIPNFNNGTYGVKIQEHINQTPLDVWRPIIDTFCPHEGSILDYCMGSGSIGMVSKELGRKYTGIEIYDPFYNIAVKNIAKIKNGLITEFF